MRLGSRGSPLALVQAETVRRAYLDRFPDETVEVVVIKTTGDLDADRPLDSFGGSGVFVRELERALLEGRIDAAVHSAKDLAVDDAEGLELVAFLEREDAHDVLIRRRPQAVQNPGVGFRIATDSSRRRAQLADAWPGVEFTEIRGNIETRLQKLAGGGADADALVLAAAGLRRLDLRPEGEEPLSIPICVPAPGQGAIAVQVREGDTIVPSLRWLNHIATSLAVQAERDLAGALGAGCSVPLGAHVEFRAAETRLNAAFHDGDRLYRVEARSPATDALEAVQLAIADLRDQGARWGRTR